ncbi:unnamed protein product [Mytilus coruscus]|uniref:Uncharacterized protein n=1 Tax=Mytilus coruscus TaxID=42192 RepID=A0A6J8DNF6_MYTCO|nr:unnamed protein product [Mytilus coruscus]
MSESDKLKYMEASSSDVVMATVIFSVLMTLLGLNIIFYLICKFISRPRRDANLDVKQVKRIKVKSASQISKDFEKESIRLLIQQLQPLSRRNSQSETKDVLHMEEGTNLGQPNNKDDLTVSTEHKHRGRLNSESSFGEQIEIFVENTKDNESHDSKDKSSSNTSKDKSGKHFKSSIFGKLASSLSERNKSSTKSVKKQNGTSKNVKKGNTSKKKSEEKVLDVLKLEECSNIDSSKINEFQTQIQNEIPFSKKVCGKNINPPRKEPKSDSFSTQTAMEPGINHIPPGNLMADSNELTETNDNQHNKTNVAITLTTDDGLQTMWQ